MSAVGGRALRASDRFYDRVRDPRAKEAAGAAPTASGFGALRGAKYCLLVSFRRSGEPMPTPVWFGLDADSHAHVRTEADAAKVKRIRANARVLLAPCSARGNPTGPFAEGTARVLPAQEEPRAERALCSNYGLGRRIYETVSGPLGVKAVYLEVTPSHVA
jgi:PPOX class probable F420-dependent enzyme